ncbi:MAG: hypothetical protein GY722_08350, partial [bacterium]|nr:hypothetical protein [bacterium]
LRQIRFDEFLREVAHLTADVMGAMGKALIEYGPGADLGLEKASDEPSSEGNEE